MGVTAAVVGAVVAAAGTATSVQASRSQKKVQETQIDEARGREKAAEAAEKEGRINKARAADVAKRGAARRKSAGTSALLSGGPATGTATGLGTKTVLGQ